MKTLLLLLVPLFSFSAPGEELLKANEEAALAVLSSNANLQQKAKACQQLAVIGGPKSIPSLAALLGDEKLAAYARSGLESINDPAAGQALLDALPKLNGRLLVGAVNSLGVRKEEAAVPALKKLVTSPKRGAAAPALTALAQIGSDAALLTILKVLEKGPDELRIPAAHATLIGAEKLFQQERSEAAHKFLKAVSDADLPPKFNAAAKAVSAKYPGSI